MRGKPVESSHRHGPGSSGDRTLCAAVGSAAAAFFFTTNASRKVTLALDGSRSTTFFFLALALPVFLMAVAPAGRPAPGRYPPEQPFLPAIIVNFSSKVDFWQKKFSGSGEV